MKMSNSDNIFNQIGVLVVVPNQPHGTNEHPQLKLSHVRVSPHGSPLKIPNKKTPTSDSFLHGNKTDGGFL